MCVCGSAFLQKRSHFSSHFCPTNRSRFGSRTGDPSSRSSTRMERFLWTTVQTPATPWPVILRHPLPFGTVTLTPTRWDGDKCRSLPSARRPHTWKITATIGTHRARTYSTRGRCTIRRHNRASGRCTNRLIP